MMAANKAMEEDGWWKMDDLFERMTDERGCWANGADDG